MGEKTDQDRIDELEDQRIANIDKKVDEIHKILVGNGSEGIISRVKSNTIRSKAVVWGLGVIYIAVVGGIVKIIVG